MPDTNTPPPPSSVRPPQVVWPSDELTAMLPPGRLNMTCPNCGSAAAKSLVLAVDFITPDHPLRRSHVLRCRDCTCCFYDDQNPPDYAEESMLGRGRVPFYVQQGAGVWLITRPLGQVRKPPGSAYMEVGCGYGFGLDFAIRAKGWDGRGIDPAGLSALGRDQLQLPIELRYLRDDDEARGTMDVVMGSEVIEHVPSPSAFVRTLRAMLKPGGVLVLTTPNGEHLAPTTPPGALVPLLSPGLHLVFQNPGSLRHLLAQEGFAHVQVETDSHSLVAFASDAPLDVETDRISLRAAYRAHLENRARAVPSDSDLFLAFAGRALQECSNDGDAEGAERAWQLLVPACSARFGLNLDTLEALPAGVQTCNLEEMARLVPLNLGGLLYARSIQQVAAGVPRPTLERRFALAAEAANAMRRALGALAMEDGMTEEIGWVAAAEALLCAAAAGAPDVVARLHALPPAPAGDDADARRRAILERALVGLVNAGHYALGRELVAAEGLDSDFGSRPISPSARDARFALGVLDMQRDGDPARARDRFAEVRSSLQSELGGSVPPDESLFWAAMHGEFQASRALHDEAGVAQLRRVALAACGGDAGLLPDEFLAEPQLAERQRFVTLTNSGRYGQARRAADALRLQELPWITDPSRGLGGIRRDILFCLAMLDLQRGGSPERARQYFARVRAGLQPRDPRYWPALRGELDALDLVGARDEATTLADVVLRQAGDAAGEAPKEIRRRAAADRRG